MHIYIPKVVVHSSKRLTKLPSTLGWAFKSSELRYSIVLLCKWAFDSFLRAFYKHKVFSCIFFYFFLFYVLIYLSTICLLF